MQYKGKLLYVFGICSSIMFATPIHGIYKETKEQEKEIAKETTQQKDSIQTHTFKEDNYKNHNPLFGDTRQSVSINYTSTLGLSDMQTLLFNGITTHYHYPLTWKKWQLQAFGNMALGNTLLTTQVAQNNAFFYGINAGLQGSIPLSMQDVIAHAIFGIDMGFAILTQQAANTPLHSYMGVDFLYERYVFRPFIGLSAIIPFSSTHYLSVAGITEIGIKTFYRGDSVFTFAKLAISYLFSKNNANIFILLPQATPLYMGANALAFNFHGGVQYFTTQYLRFHAQVMVTYTSSYYALSTSGQIGINYRF